jgi:hypothetical protein
MGRGGEVGHLDAESAQVGEAAGEAVPVRAVACQRGIVSIDGDAEGAVS